jgi:NitT/TauT family transport system substrate-binding protein
MSELVKHDSSRRQLLTNAIALGAAGLLGINPKSSADAGGLETTRIRITHAPSICTAPQYLAEELLRMEGFTQIEYLSLGTRYGPYAVAAGRADVTMWDLPGLMPLLDAGRSIVLLAGVHAGCYQLFASERVRAISELKGKTVAIQYPNSGDHVFLSSMLAYLGLNPQRDINWVAGHHMSDAMTFFANGKADAFMAYGQQGAELRARKVGRVIVNTAQDRPWSQYFCCMIAANRDFVQRNPVATKRLLRAILKSADMCANDPLGVARFLSDKLYEPRFQIGLEVMKSISYTRWREAEPEDSLRFHALRLYEVGMIKTSPQKLIAQSTDWRFLNELRQELKA